MSDQESEDNKSLHKHGKDNGDDRRSKKRHSSSESSSRRSRSRSHDASHRKLHSRKHHRSPRSRRHHHHRSHRRSRSRERSHRDRSSHKRHRDSSHRSKDHRRSSRKRSISPKRRSRSPRNRSKSPKRKSRSPQRSKGHARSDGSASPDSFGGAMAAQERLAHRMEKAKMRQRVKERRGNGWNGGRNKMTSEEKEKKYEEQKKQATEMLEKAGVNIPSYYNPFAVNPMQIAKQTEKRKKLWAKTDDSKIETPIEKPPASAAMWSKMNFGDSKSNEKFAKLMGIKNPDELAKKTEGNSAASELIKKQEDIFKSLDQQYTQARITTHTQRGIGLGFTTNYVDPNLAPQSIIGNTVIPTSKS